MPNIIVDQDSIISINIDIQTICNSVSISSTLRTLNSSGTPASSTFPAFGNYKSPPKTIMLYWVPVQSGALKHPNQKEYTALTNLPSST